MSGTPNVSLDLLQVMIQRVLDGQKMMRDDNRNNRRRLGRIERAVLSLQRSDVDRSEAEVGTQDEIDDLTARLERLEARGSETP